MGDLHFEKDLVKRDHYGCSSRLLGASSDENILIIKVRAKRDKGPKKWSLAFGLLKFKMFTREDK